MPHNQTAQELGVPIGTVVKVERNGRHYHALTPTGEDITSKIASYALKNAFRSRKALLLEETKTGGTRWSQVPLVEFDKVQRGQAIQSDTHGLNIADDEEAESFSSHDEIVSFIGDAMNIKPKKLRISEKWWKFAVRSAIRGKNLLVVGPSGCGKTLLANSVKVALGREDKFFYVNLGATQDPRSTLIGNTHYDKEKGTFVALSYFARAIQTPHAIILLDEVSRAHPEAWNILMTPLDYTQRYLRVDEAADTRTIHVATGVTFILTANVGSEYTATRTLDRALLDRCTIIEMTPLSYDEELANLRETYPNVEDRYLMAIAGIADETRREYYETETPRVDTIVSTRMAEEMAGLVYDGFSLTDAAEVEVLPWFASVGGQESPREYVRKIVEKFKVTEFDSKTTPFRGGDPNKAGGKDNEKLW